MKIFARRKILLIIILTVSGLLGNEIIFTQKYTADPVPLVHNGRVYIYCTHDRDDDYTDYSELYDYICISSEDLVNWTDHGTVFDIRNVEWLPQDERIAWAPAIAERDGTFYLYWCTPGVEGDRANTAGTGVAVSEDPTGPFEEALGERLITGWYVDPDILIDKQQAYICWPGPRMYKLKDNMLELEGAEISYNIDDAHEAAYLTKINGKYQYSYQTFQGWERWGEKDQISHMMHRYMIGDSPMGPFENPGESRSSRTFLWPTYNAFNTQPGIFYFEGKYYSAYHSGKLAATQGKRMPEVHRNVGLDRLYVNEDGTFKFQTITQEGLRQVKYLDPYEKNQAETMASSQGIETADCDDIGGGRKVTLIDPQDWIRIIGVDFGTGADSIVIRAASEEGGEMELYLNEPDGTYMGTVSIPSTGSTSNWNTVKAKISTITGIHDLYFKFTVGKFDFNWWRFTGGNVSGKTPPPVVKNVALKSAITKQYITVDSVNYKILLSNKTESSQLSKAESFFLIDNEDGSYSFKSGWTGKYINVEDYILKANSDKIEGSSERFQLRYVNGDYCLKSFLTGKYVNAPNHSEESIPAMMEEPWEYKDTSRARFKIEYIDLQDPTYIKINKNEIQSPDKFNLKNNFPNPFNSSTNIEYSIHQPCHVSLAVYDLMGRKIKTLVSKQQKEGQHFVKWSGRNSDGEKVSTGIYLYKIRVHNQIKTRKLLFLK